jgi:hypothetical protein
MQIDASLCARGTAKSPRLAASQDTEQEEAKPSRKCTFDYTQKIINLAVLKVQLIANARCNVIFRK